MSRKLKIGVVGAGVFGGYHAAKCAAHPRVDYVGTYDKSFARAEAVATPKGGRGFRDYGLLLAACDAVVIATPASQHGVMALRALKAGCHTLIEKPIATTQVAAQRIIDSAALNNLIVQVGHQERFVAKAIGLDRIAETPTRIAAVRHSPYSPRGTDVSVTLDLMTHDIDMVLWLLGADADEVRGHSIVVQSDTPDASLAHLQIGGTRVRLSASRVEPASERVMRLTYPSGDVLIDFNAKTLVNHTDFDLNSDFGQSPMAQDSLGAATNSFVSAVLDGTDVEITGGHGLRALNVALQIDKNT
jgi:predicted dehydrogenase